MVVASPPPTTRRPSSRALSPPISTRLGSSGPRAGNSLVALVALRLALSEPEKVGALALIDSAGLGREVTYALQLPTLPGYDEGAVAWGKTVRENMPSSNAGRWLTFEVAEERPWAEARRRVEQTGAEPEGGPREEEHDGYHVEHTERIQRGGHGV